MLLLLFLVVATSAVQSTDKPYYDLNDAENHFLNFIQEHGKEYDSEEYLHRLEVFKENLAEINERNARHPDSVSAVTQFADLTNEERKVLHGGMKQMDKEFRKLATKLHYKPEQITAPEQWDWREHGAVTHVKNRGKCGSCWIFAATGLIEGQYAIKYNKTLAFSEQQSLDCRGNCDKGWPDKILKYATNHGVILEKENPYVGHKSTCHQHPTKVITKVTGYQVYENIDEETLKQLVYERGPLSIGINYSDMEYHKKGIVYPDTCDTEIGHLMVLVGYGVENGTKYWILKDSYGLGSGEKGYFKLVRGMKACAIGEYTATCTVA